MPFKDPAARAAYKARYDAEHRAGKTARQRRYKKTDGGRAVESTARTRTTARRHRFVGVDGEGYTDPLGRHHYMCLIAGDRVLRNADGSPLTSEQCLGWLADLPREKDLFYVGFFFDYDATMILRGMAETATGKAKELLNVKPRDPDEQVWWNPRRYGSPVPWRGFAVDYVPKKRLRVGRWLEPGPDGRRRHTPMVEIHDVRNFYQSAFVKALDKFSIGTVEQREYIADMKADREDFDPERADEIIRYSKLECELLADMVAKLRDDFVAAGLSAWPYEGPGPVAGRVLEKHVTGKARMERIRAQVPDDVWDLAARAYYGGRFEVTAHGTVRQRVWEYDLKSAYPAAMLRLPCLEHGDWEPGTHGRFWVGEVAWDMPLKTHPEYAAGVMGPLPFRTDAGSIHFPVAGRGWYWNVEVPDYATVVGDTWSYVDRCDCQPFAFVQRMYNQRAAMEAAAKGSGIGLKLTLNSLYGKLAQRIGKAPHYNPVWASLITALTRSWVYGVYRDHPGRVVMIATDAVFVTEECPELEIGTGLGQWEQASTFGELTIFQPGVYFDGGEAKFKTRGVPKKRFAQRAGEFMAAANDFTRTVELDLTNHLGLKLGLSWGGDWIGRIGDWLPQTKKMNASPVLKRAATVGGGLMMDRYGTSWSCPIPGDIDLETVPYNHGSEEIVFEDQGDWEDGLADGPE